MIRTFILGFALSTGLALAHAAPAYAQVTDQTDQSEEDWRKSKKKKNTSDIFEDIIDIRNSGSGVFDRPLTPMETLPEDSRRHLQKERAKLLANADMGGNDEIKSITDAGYTPSEAAKSDPDLAEQEKEAWDVILTDLKGGGQNSQSGQPQDGPNKVAVVGQGGGSGSEQGRRGNSTMRGGSSQSVADILAQIKGLQSGGGGSPQGSGQGPLGTDGQGQSQNQGNGQSGQQGQGIHGQQGQTSGQQSGGQAQQNSGQSGDSQQSAQNSGQGQQQAEQGQGQSQQADGQSQNDAQSNAQSDSNANSASQAQAAADAQAASEAQAAAQTQQTPRETISPLDRIKNSRESQSSGRRTSASDYLNTGNTPD